jgi:cytochrome c551/c552
MRGLSAKREAVTRRATLIGVSAALAVLAICSPALAQNDDCLLCHQDSELTGTRGKAEFSAYVDAALLQSSVHRDLDCVMCHQDLDGVE